MNPQIQDADLARCAIQLLQRASLTGAEVPTYIAVVQWLERLAGPSTPHEHEVVES